jgi:hypothetical protein
LAVFFTAVMRLRISLSVAISMLQVKMYVNSIVSWNLAND